MSEIFLHHERAAAPGRPPLLILHGLFGSSRNWTSAAKRLRESANLDVYALDLRNHGSSPHADSHTLSDLREDVRRWMDRHVGGGAQSIVLGHSMGGVAAMAFALEYPERTRALIVVDIAPRSYAPHHDQEFAALSVRVDDASSRQVVDERMRAHVQTDMVRQFLQMNLDRLDGGGYRWKINVPVLKDAAFTSGIELGDRSYDGPTLFVRGGDSDYITDDDFDLIRERFPRARIETIAGHGHWLHYTAADEFLSVVGTFLAELQHSKS